MGDAATAADKDDDAGIFVAGNFDESPLLVAAVVVGTAHVAAAVFAASVIAVAAAAFIKSPA
jgi:hypothetical protein